MGYSLRDPSGIRFLPVGRAEVDAGATGCRRLERLRHPVQGLTDDHVGEPVAVHVSRGGHRVPEGSEGIGRTDGPRRGIVGPGGAAQVESYRAPDEAIEGADDEVVKTVAVHVACRGQGADLRSVRSGLGCPDPLRRKTLGGAVVEYGSVPEIPARNQDVVVAVTIDIARARHKASGRAPDRSLRQPARRALVEVGYPDAGHDHVVIAVSVDIPCARYLSAELRSPGRGRQERIHRQRIGRTRILDADLEAAGHEGERGIHVGPIGIFDSESSVAEDNLTLPASEHHRATLQRSPVCQCTRESQFQYHRRSGRTGRSGPRKREALLDAALVEAIPLVHFAAADFHLLARGVSTTRRRSSFHPLPTEAQQAEFQRLLRFPRSRGLNPEPRAVDPRFHVANPARRSENPVLPADEPV